jgi:hypothetical protein
MRASRLVSDNEFSAISSMGMVASYPGCCAKWPGGATTPLGCAYRSTARAREHPRTFPRNFVASSSSSARAARRSRAPGTPPRPPPGRLARPAPSTFYLSAPEIPGGCFPISTGKRIWSWHASLVSKLHFPHTPLYRDRVCPVPKPLPCRVWIPAWASGQKLSLTFCLLVGT